MTVIPHRSVSIIHNITRQIVPCDRDGCVYPAKHQVVVALWMLGRAKSKKPATKVLTNLCVCEVHKMDTTASDLLDNDGKSMMLGVLSHRGFTLPDFKTAEIEFEPIRNGRKVDPGLGSEWATRREV